MPLGISESTLKAAYGPVDLGEFYKTLDAASKRYEAEDKLSRAAQQKEFYSTMGMLNRDMSGIRGEDSDEIMQDYNKWKNIQQKLVANPRLMQEHPDLYGKLYSEAEGHYGNVMSKINASKYKKEELKRLFTEITSPTNKNRYKDDAATLYNKVSKMSTKELAENNLDNLSNFLYQGPDFSKVSKQFDEISKLKKDKGVIMISQSPKYGGMNVYTEYEIPKVSDIQNKIDNIIGSYNDKDAQAILDRYEPIFKSHKQEYINIPEAVFEQFKTPEGADKFPLDPLTNSRKIQLNFDSDNPRTRLNAYLLARQLNGISSATPVSNREYQTNFKLGKEGAKQMVNDYAVKIFKQLEPLKQESRRSNIMLDKTFAAEINTLLKVAGFGSEVLLTQETKLTPEKINEIESLLSKGISDLGVKIPEMQKGLKEVFAPPMKAKPGKFD